MKYALGIDVSTTATKALLVDEAGSVIASAASEYPFETPRPLWAEQHPKLWWEAGVNAIQSVLKESQIDASDVIGVGLTGQMHGLVLLDEQGEVLRPAILWNDQRTGAECDEIRERVGAERLIELTGNDALTGFTAPKVLWVRNHEPELFDRARHILLPKDYLRYRLTGDFATDRAGAAGTLLLDLKSRDWSDEVLRALDLDPSLLPETHEGTEATGVISSQAASATGLRAGTRVVAGGGDQAAGAVGVGAVEEGIVSLVLGTSGVVFATTDQPFFEPEGKVHAFCHAVPDRWHLMGVILSAAGSLRWYRDTFAVGTSFDDLLQPVSDVVPGADGLVYLPYLTGERTPHPDPLARGAFVGMTVRHTQPHFTRAVLEGVAFGLRDGYQLMRYAGLPQAAEIRVSGGGARSQLWRQILADVLGAELVTVNTTDGAPFGAAILAHVSAGTWSSVDDACSAVVRPVDRTSPRPAVVDQYNELYQTYHDLYPALKRPFHALAAFEERERPDTAVV